MMARQMRLLGLVSMLLVMGCGGDNGGHHHDDPFIVESVSSTEWHIFRDSGGPFDLALVQCDGNGSVSEIGGQTECMQL